MKVTPQTWITIRWLKFDVTPVPKNRLRTKRCVGYPDDGWFTRAVGGCENGLIFASSKTSAGCPPDPAGVLQRRINMLHRPRCPLQGLQRRRPACRRVGRGEQRRTRLHADLLKLAEPDRGPVHRAALLRPRWHRPRQPRRAGLDDPPLHPLAEPQRSRQGTTRPRQPRERCLTRH